MLRAVERLGDATHMTALMLTVQTDNHAARAFYAQCGCGRCFCTPCYAI
jgi:hypothetical protein